jgi:hypothetical protein
MDFNLHNDDKITNHTLTGECSSFSSSFQNASSFSSFSCATPLFPPFFKMPPPSPPFHAQLLFFLLFAAAAVKFGGFDIGQDKILYELSDTVVALHNTYFWCNSEQTLIK